MLFGCFQRANIILILIYLVLTFQSFFVLIIKYVGPFMSVQDIWLLCLGMIHRECEISLFYGYDRIAYKTVKINILIK